MMRVIKKYINALWAQLIVIHTSLFPEHTRYYMEHISDVTLQTSHQRPHSSRFLRFVLGLPRHSLFVWIP
jgi:hypothetical protein